MSSYIPNMIVLYVLYIYILIFNSPLKKKATSTGSATAIVEIYPELKGKLNGLGKYICILMLILMLFIDYSICIACLAFLSSWYYQITAVRVPLLNGSLTDCVFEVKSPVTKEEVNAALKEASENGPLKGILGYETKPLVSSDYTNDTRSSIIDALSTQVIDGTMVKVYAWYDNEAGYSKRMAELCNITAAMNITGTEPSFKYE